MEIKEEDVRFNLPSELSAHGAIANYRAGMSSPSLQIADALLVDVVSQTLRRAVELPARPRKPAKATGGPISPPTPRSNPISFCWSCGGIRPWTACGIRRRAD